ncbi:MAG TPA: hypothetical protein VLA74_09765, partial [Nitrososphaeraceae archaeon]|nr:hypothetical protein [Nitrososphaeraceae archaeon]
IDFIKRIDSRYDSKIKTIFVILDNASIHRSKKTINTITRYYPRIVLVISSYPITTSKFNRNKMVMDAETGNKQFYI